MLSNGWERSLPLPDGHDILVKNRLLARLHFRSAARAAMAGSAASKRGRRRTSPRSRDLYQAIPNACFVVIPGCAAADEIMDRLLLLPSEGAPHSQDQPNSSASFRAGANRAPCMMSGMWSGAKRELIELGG